MIMIVIMMIDDKDNDDDGNDSKPLHGEVTRQQTATDEDRSILSMPSQHTVSVN